MRYKYSIWKRRQHTDKRIDVNTLHEWTHAQQAVTYKPVGRGDVGSPQETTYEDSYMIGTDLRVYFDDDDIDFLPSCV
jgi:hypothetical protein